MCPKKGFTLIEMLVVILLIAIASGIVAPVAYKSVEKFDNLIEKAKKEDVKRYIHFLEFITDSKCKVDNNSAVYCGDIKYALK